MITESNLIFRIQYVWFLGVFGGLLERSLLPLYLNLVIRACSPITTSIMCGNQGKSVFFLQEGGGEMGRSRLTSGKASESSKIFLHIFQEAWTEELHDLCLFFCKMWILLDKKNGCPSQRIGSHQARLFGLTYFTYLKWTIHHECESCSFLFNL